jgi:hypothetical protein
MEVTVVVNMKVAVKRTREVILPFVQLTVVVVDAVNMMVGVTGVRKVQHFAYLMEVAVFVNMKVAVKRKREVPRPFVQLTVVVASVSMMVDVKRVRKVQLNFAKLMEVGAAVFMISVIRVPLAKHLFV